MPKSIKIADDKYEFVKDYATKEGRKFKWVVDKAIELFMKLTKRKNNNVAKRKGIC